MKIDVKRIFLTLCLLLGCSLVRAGESIVDWLPIKNAMVLLKDNGLSQDQRLATSSANRLGSRSEMLVNWNGQDYLSIELQRYQKPSIGSSSVDLTKYQASFPLVIYASKGDGLFVELQAEKSIGNSPEQHRWMISNPDGKYNQVLLANSSAQAIAVALHQGKIRNQFDWFKYAQVYLSQKEPTVSITSSFDSTDDFNLLSQASLVETLTGPALYRFEVFYPWKQEYGANEQVQIDVKVGSGALDSRYIKIQPNRFDTQAVNHVSNVLSRKKNVDVWVPKGEHIVKLIGDRPLFSRWLIAERNKQLLLNELQSSSEVANILSQRHSVDILEQRNFEYFRNQQIAYRSIFPQEPVTTIDTQEPSVNVSRNHSQQYSVRQNNYELASLSRLGTNQSSSTQVNPNLNVPKTKLVKQQPASQLHYKIAGDSFGAPLRLKIQPSNNRQAFKLISSENQVVRLIYDALLIGDYYFLPDYENTRYNHPPQNAKSRTHTLAELMTTAVIKFDSPQSAVTLVNLSEHPLVHQLSYGFIRPVETSESAFYYQLERLRLSHKDGTFPISGWLFDRLMNMPINKAIASQSNLSHYFYSELKGWADRLDKRVANFSLVYSVSTSPITEERSQREFAKLVDAVTALDHRLSLNKNTKNIDETFSIFTKSLVKRGNYPLLKKTLYFFTQSENEIIQQSSESHLLSVFASLQDWSELESYWAIRLKSADLRSFSGIAASWLKQGRTKQAARLFLLDSILTKQLYTEAVVALSESNQTRLLTDALNQLEFAETALGKKSQVTNQSSYCSSDATKTKSISEVQKKQLQLTCLLHLPTNVSYLKSVIPPLLSRNKTSLLHNKTLDLYFKSVMLNEQSPIHQKLSGPALMKVSFYETANSRPVKKPSTLTFKLANKPFEYPLLPKTKVSNIVVSSDNSPPLLVNQTFWIYVPAGDNILELSVEGAAGEVTLSELVGISSVIVGKTNHDDHFITAAVVTKNNDKGLFKQHNSETTTIQEQDYTSTSASAEPISTAKITSVDTSLQPFKSYFNRLAYTALKRGFSPSHHIVQFVKPDNMILANSITQSTVLSHAKELALFSQIAEFENTDFSDKHLIFANDLKNYVKEVNTSVELLAVIKQFLRNFEWQPIDSVISSAGRIKVLQEREQGESEYSQVRNALLLSRVKQHELPLYKESQRVIQYYSASAFTAILEVRALTTLGEADGEVVVDVTSNDSSKSFAFNSRRRLSKPIYIKAGLNTIKLNVKQSDDQLFYLSLFKETRNNIRDSLIEKGNTNYYAASRPEPLKIYMPKPGWIRVEALTSNGEQVFEEYVSEPGVITFSPLIHDLTKYRIAKLVQSKANTKHNNAPDLMSSLNSAGDKNQFYWQSFSAPILFQFDNISLDELPSATHSASLGYRSNNVLEEEPLVQSGDEQLMEYRYRRHLRDYSSYVSNRLRYKQASQFKTLSNRLHVDYIENRNINFEFDLNAYYQLQSQNEFSEGAFRLAAGARANWNYFWNNQVRNKLSSKLELGYLSYSDELKLDTFASDPEVYSQYKQDHLNKVIISDRLNFRPYFDTQFILQASIHTNEISEEFSLDNYDFAASYRHIWQDLRFEAKFRHKVYLNDDLRVASFVSNRARLQLDYAFWTNHSNLWQLSLAYQYEIKQKESQVQLWFTWSPTKRQYLDDFSPIDEPFLKLREYFIGEQRLNNLVVEESHD